MHRTKTFTKGDQTLVLVGNAHVMPKECWDDIKTKFETCDIVLCEGVVEDKDDFMKPLAQVKKTDNKIRKLYDLIAKSIDWVDQMHFYDEVSKNPKFVSCDTDNSATSPVAEKLDKLFESIDNEEEFVKQMTNTKWLIKFVIAKSAVLSSVFMFFCRKTRSELVTKRNDIVVSTVKDLPHKKIGVLYGLGHFKSMESSLLGLGWNILE